MFRSNLFRRILLVIAVLIVGYSAAMYAFSVPLIRRSFYQTEENAAKTILQNVHDLVEADALALEAYRRHALDAYKRELKDIVLMQESFLRLKYEDYESGRLTEEEAKQSALEDLRYFRFGNQDYVWVADFNSVMLSHPDHHYLGRDLSDIRDVEGVPVIPRLVELVQNQFEGYLTYWWRRLDSGKPSRKLAFARRFPAWDWIMGSGIYIDDIEEQMERRKTEMIADLRLTLKSVKIAGSGYLFVFDSKLNMIIHPNKDLENTNFTRLLNPVTGRPIGVELIEAAKLPEPKLYYKWDRPDDKNRFEHEKISWVTYVPEFDWYIASSVYVDELNAGADRLRNRVLYIGLGFLGISILLAMLLVNRLLVPARNLSEMAERVRKGDLTVQADTRAVDEFGLLAETFNDMVRELKSLIENLDAKVRDRTLELKEKNQKLQREIAERKKAEEESQRTQAAYRTIFENAVEGIFQARPDGEFIKANPAMASLLGYGSPEELIASVQNTTVQFFADTVQRKEFLTLMKGAGLVTNFETRIFKKSGQAVWVSISARAVRDEQGELLYMEGLAKDVTEWKISELELQRKAMMDELTGLPNRFLFFHTYRKMLAQAARDNVQLAILYVDLDYFKEVNDTHGHHVGDLVLREVGRRLRSRLRESDSAARIGGDEFVVLLWNVCSDQDIQTTAGAIIEKLSQPYRLNSQVECRIGASIGVSIYPQNGLEPNELLEKADRAMYSVKQNGRNGIAIAAA